MFKLHGDGVSAIREVSENRQKEKEKMTDKEYIDYLSKWLRFGSDDCCAKCAYDPKTKLCRNWTRKGDLKDEKTCYEGMRKYAEENQGKAHQE